MTGSYYKEPSITEIQFEYKFVIKIKIRGVENEED